ncbi:MAG: hypothetical protein GX446_10790 [Chthonomonadales bacterium]|nr:hypothetical protein [Chthonomonadales bacterium]
MVKNAQPALEQLKKTAIFYVFGHGGSAFQSCQTFWNNGQWGAIVQTTGARDYVVGQGMPYANVVVLDERDASGQLIIASNAFRRVLLAVYLGCYTAELAGRGSPVQSTYNHGAKCVLGFRNVVYEASARSWASSFWDALRDGQTVSSAAIAACQGLPLNDTMRERTLLGNGQTRVQPARYGQ